MSRNGSGTYSAPVNSWNPQTAGVSATAADFGALLTDLAAALTQSVSADGQTAITGNIAMGGYKLTGLAAGSATGNSVRWEQLFSQGTEADIASASTCDIGGQYTNFLRVTGTTQIDSLGTNYNGPRFLRFAGALALKYNATTLITPGAADITTAAGDRAIVVPVASGGTANGWQVVAYQRAAGLNALAVDASSCGVTQSTGRMLGRITAGSGNIEQLTAAQVAAFTAAASDTAQGVVELATSAEMQTGTDTGRVPSVSSLRSGLLVNATMQASTSGSTIDFTGIPSWAKRITVMFDGVSVSGTDSLLVQIGDAGGVETSGYLGAAGVIQNAGSSTTANFTTGYGIVSGAAGNVINGAMYITLMDAASFRWVATHSVGWSNSAIPGFGGGSKSLSAALDRVRITVSGANTFDAGNINVLYE